MTQRVNITYSVEIDQLDTEVQRLIKDGLIRIQEVVSKCNSIDLALPLTLEVYQNIDDIRQQMAKADIILNDVSNIINGYLSYMSRPPEQQQPPSMDELQNKINEFKETMDFAD